MFDKTNICYQIIRQYYGPRKAQRSGLPYMKHIDDGIKILEAIDASQTAIEAFCIHPIVQEDDYLCSTLNGVLFDDIPGNTLATAFLYREIANSYLSNKELNVAEHRELEEKLQKHIDVQHMLVADKVQNKFDFMNHHYEIHERSDELLEYFNTWIDDLLGADYFELRKHCSYV